MSNISLVAGTNSEIESQDSRFEIHDVRFDSGDLGDRRLVDDLLQSKTTHRWAAASGAIGHQRGRVHSNGDWWNDPCDAFRGWTCYGPYVNLERGSYRAEWYVSIQMNESNNDDLGIDVVGLVGNYQIVPEKRFNLTGPDQEGLAIIEFTLFDDIDKVEVRLRSHPGAKFLIAKELRIIQTNA